MINDKRKNEDKGREENLGGNKGEITGIGASFGTTFTPIDEAKSVMRVSWQAESVDEGSCENGLFETIGASFAIEVWENEANGREVVTVDAKRV